jgi:pimeloyl-ACP methyl ester carboxylesterase
MLKNIKKAGFEERQFDSGEVKLNYVEGPDNGLPMILIPAQAASWENYQKVLVTLSLKFHVFVLDIRGHGKSDWTPCDYTFESIGRDMSSFMHQIVKKPAIISGNSSGGLIAVWIAANLPECTLAIILEDVPLFSADWPRIKTEYVYHVLKSTVEIIEVLRESRSVKKLKMAFDKIQRPVSSDKTRKLPGWITYPLAWLIRFYQSLSKGEIISIPLLPGKLRALVETLSTYDPDFSKAWVDGRIYQGFNHEEALKNVKCPVLLLHANWFRHQQYGLVGAMDDEDAARVCAITNCHYIRVDSEHVIHTEQPRIFIHRVEEFVKNNLDD